MMRDICNAKGIIHISEIIYDIRRTGYKCVIDFFQRIIEHNNKAGLWTISGETHSRTDINGTNRGHKTM